MKRHIFTAGIYLAVIGVTVACAALVLPVPKAAALPAASFADSSGLLPQVGDKCGLPDGSTGLIQDDKKTCCPGSNTNTNASGWATTCFFGKYINPVIALLSAATGVLVVISIMYGAFETVTAGSDVARAAEGRKRIIQALIGLFAYMSLFVLLQFLIPGGIV
jgi:hypothetical protein